MNEACFQTQEPRVIVSNSAHTVEFAGLSCYTRAVLRLLSCRTRMDETQPVRMAVIFINL